MEYVGARWPLNIGCSRRAILAFLGDTQITEFTNQCCSEKDDLEQLTLECGDIRRRGYAVSWGEVTPDSYGVAAPIWYRNEPVASIMAGGPQQRIQTSEIKYLGELVCHHANEIGRTLVGSG